MVNTPGATAGGCGYPSLPRAQLLQRDMGQRGRTPGSPGGAGGRCQDPEQCPGEVSAGSPGQEVGTRMCPVARRPLPYALAWALRHSGPRAQLWASG